MANPFQGEVALRMNGERHVLKLTLGALAELEAGLETDTLVALVTRFEEGKFSSADVLRIVVAGLRGGGWTGGYDDILTAEIAGGPLEAARVGAELIARAFTVPA
ncbi:gene transfer agent family protein [Celeribacter halophilus]|uniref:gene transfer agent family protein n=1 Tax=Celeribacter halophilus TaxID=576117 RepID=UPI003A93E719